MIARVNIIIAGFLLLSSSVLSVKAQEPDSAWTLNKCIDYALQKNIQIRKSSLNAEVNKVTAEKQKAGRFPSLNASASQNFSWNKSLSTTNTYGSYEGSNNTSVNLNSSLTLFSGGKISKSIQQAQVNYEASQYQTEMQKEEISLSILNAYLQVLFANEQVNNSLKQVEITGEQLRLADERLKLGAISKSDYLQVKSELASEKRTLTNAENTLAINRLNLQQLMELPLDSAFVLANPQIGDSVNQHLSPDAIAIYNTAMGIKPEIKNAGLNKQSAELDVDIAKAARIPQLDLSAGLSTGYSSSMSGMAYDYQFQNRLVPSVGLTLSIPIFQRKQISSQIAIAKIGSLTAGLNITDTQNKLRKSVEQACLDINAAENEYDASLEQWNAASESFEVASEKFNNGLLSSLDFLTQKNNLIIAENNLLQSKYNLIFNYKILDFYSGIAISL